MNAGHHPKISRRAAIKKGLAGILAAALAPEFIPSSLLGASAPSKRINIGMIGNGLQCGGHFAALIGRDDCRLVAFCDVNLSKAEKLRDQAKEHYASQSRSGSYEGPVAYSYHEELLARGDIDAVWICTPDHWHVPLSIAAMRTGRDVYCEKPLTLTIREGRTLVDTARRYGRILQTGSQQRSNGAFRKAAEIVRNGWLGKITRIRTSLGEFPQAPVLAEQPVPKGFDYDRWLGPTPWRPYNEARVRGDFGGGWRCFYEYGARKNGDWGAHHFDIIQWALGMDESGPVSFTPKGWQGTPYQTHRYANGITVERVDEGLKAMIEFTGTEGTVWVSRGDYLVTDPADLASRPLRSSDVHLYVSENHQGDFLDSVRTRQRPICDVETGHRSATVCHLNAIAERLGRPIEWDPSTEQIPNDPEASQWLDRVRRSPYALL